MEEDHQEYPCPNCGGSGIDPQPEYAHHHSCDGSCKGLCPVPIPKPCEYCGGNGNEMDTN